MGEGVGGAADSLVGEGPVSFISRTTESDESSTEETIAGGSSASTSSGSVAHGALCRGVEDSRCSLLASMTLSFPSAVMGMVDKEDLEWPFGSLTSDLTG